MVTVTPQAAAQILRSANGAALRLAAKLGDQGVIEYGMGFDDQAGSDLQFESAGVKIVVSPGSVELLTGATLDYVELNPGEWRFIFVNPNDPSHKPPRSGP